MHSLHVSRHKGLFHTTKGRMLSYAALAHQTISEIGVATASREWLKEKVHLSSYKPSNAMHTCILNPLQNKVDDGAIMASSE